MIREKIRMRFPHCKSDRGNGHAPITVHLLSQSAYYEAYQDCLCTELQLQQHSDSSSMKQNWDTLKTSIVTAAECSLGRSRRRQPDWLQENADTLAPLIEAKNKARNKTKQTAKQRVLEAIKEKLKKNS